MFSLPYDSVMSFWKEIIMCSAYLESEELYPSPWSRSRMIPGAVFGILHANFVSLPPCIYLINSFILVWADGYLFFILVYSTMALYLFCHLFCCLNCCCFSHWEFVHLVSWSLWPSHMMLRSPLFSSSTHVPGSPCMCPTSDL